MEDDGGWDAFNIVVVKERPCENAQQACMEEDKIMRELSIWRWMDGWMDGEDGTVEMDGWKDGLDGWRHGMDG
jgi:hypothetical protein